MIETAFACKGSDHLQLIKFWPSRAPGKGVSGGTIFLAPPYYSQRAVFASPPSAFLLSVWFCSIHECTPSVYILLREGASPLAISCFGVYDSAVHSTSFFWEYIHGFIDSGSERHMHLVLRLLDAAPSSLAPSSELGENALFVSLFLSLSV